EGALLAAGVGGSIGSMIPVTFPADVHLDLTNGKTKITTGPSSRFGKPTDDKEPKLPGPGAKDPEPENKDVETKRDPNYKTPAPLLKAHEVRAEAVKKLEPAKLLARLQFGESHFRGTLPMPFAAGNDSVQMAVRRFLRVAGGLGSHSAVLTLSKDGKYGLGPTRDTSSNPLAQGQKLFFRVEHSEIDLNDLITGKPIVPPEAIKLKKAKKSAGAKGFSDLFF